MDLPALQPAACRRSSGLRGFKNNNGRPDVARGNFVARHGRLRFSEDKTLSETDFRSCETGENNKMSYEEKIFTYPAILSYESDGGLWIMKFPGLHGCWVEGKTEDDVRRRAPEVLGEFLRGCFDCGVTPSKPPEADMLRKFADGEVIGVSVRL